MNCDVVYWILILIKYVHVYEKRQASDLHNVRPIRDVKIVVLHKMTGIDRIIKKHNNQINIKYLTYYLS